MSQRILLLSLLTTACVPTGRAVEEVSVNSSDLALVHMFARAVSDSEEAMASESETYVASRQVVVYLARRDFAAITMPPSRDSAFVLTDATACYRQRSDVETRVDALEPLMKVPCDEIKAARANSKPPAYTRSVFVWIIDLNSGVWAGIDSVNLPQDFIEDRPPRFVIFSGAWMLLSRSDEEWTVVNGCLPRSTTKALQTRTRIEEVHYCATLPLDIQAESAAQGRRFY